MLEPTELTQLQVDELAAGHLTFEEIAVQYGEDAAINVGIARDPDTKEWTPAMLQKARPVIVDDPKLLAENLRHRSQKEGLMRWDIHIALDIDLLAHFLEGGPGWQERLNAALRKGAKASL